jgi:hypothetical protein
LTDTAIAVVAHLDKFTSPRQLKRKYGLDASISTIDRRLQEGELFGRVARHKRKLTRENTSSSPSQSECLGLLLCSWTRILLHLQQEAEQETTEEGDC